MPGYIEYTPPGGAAVELELSRIERYTERTVYADDDVSASHIEISLTLRARFVSTSASIFYAKLRSLQQNIMTPRGRLIVASDSTKTDIYHDINPAGGGTLGAQPDINSGPKPRDLVVEKFYKGLGANLTWTIDFAILPCELNQSDLPQVLYKTFAADFDYAQDGTVVRRVTGELRIPDKHTDIDHGPSVQQAIGQAYIAVPKGWKRNSATFGISPNGLVLRYQYEDQELEIGWHHFLQSVDATWTEDFDTLEPPKVTFDIRAKAKRGVGKRKMFNELILPMMLQRFADLGSKRMPIHTTYEENLFTNEIRASVTVMPTIPPRIADPFGDSMFPLPTGMFAEGIPLLELDSPINIGVGTGSDQGTTNFDPVLTREGQTDARFLKLPLMTRAIVKGLCDRASLDQPATYGDFAADNIVVGLIEPEPTAPDDEGEDTLFSEIYKAGNQFQEGDYIIDEEVLSIEIDYHTIVIGNMNSIKIDSDGAVQTDDTKSQRLYQSGAPEIVIKAVGRAIRIGLPAEARPIPIITQAAAQGEEGTAIELQTVPKKIRVTNFGPVPLAIGNVAGYGVQWTYISTKELDGAFFDIDPITNLTDIKIPKRPTRVDKIFTDDVIELFQWEPTV